MARGVNKPKQPKMHKQQKAKSAARPKKVEIKHMSVGSTWSKVAGAAPWVGGQSATLAPGSPAAASRRRYRQTKFKSRTRKVIRPRIQKQQRRSGKPDKQ